HTCPTRTAATRASEEKILWPAHRCRTGFGLAPALGDSGECRYIDQHQLVGFEQPGRRDRRDLHLFVHNRNDRDHQNYNFRSFWRGPGRPTYLSSNYGIGAGTVSRSGQTITYTVTSAVSVSTGVPIYIEFGANT